MNICECFQSVNHLYTCFPSAIAYHPIHKKSLTESSSLHKKLVEKKENNIFKQKNMQFSTERVGNVNIMFKLTLLQQTVFQAAANIKKMKKHNISKANLT